MIVPISYGAASALVEGPDGLALALAPNRLRDPAHLLARVREPLTFRDLMLTLHDVASSELYVSAAEIERRQLDPVITVAPADVYFEAFSLDESTYGRATLRAAALDASHRVPGTTNVEFSRALANALEAVRSRSRVDLRVEPLAFRVDGPAGAVIEDKIDLPDTWAHGFLAVQSAVRHPSVLVDLHPGDLRNLLQYLRARKEAVSPRSLRFQLDPGAPPRVLVEPWDETLAFERSTHDAAASREIRVWGRRRLLLLGRALPAAKRVRARLQATGRPSFWTLDCGPLAFTLGLSPWCDRDWAGLEPERPTGDAVADELVDEETGACIPRALFPRA